VVDAYKHAIKNVNLYGPTNFAPILDLVNEMTEQMNVTQQNQKYNILLIITDGVITDLQKTIDEIVRGSNQALSIIIVGVGSADFEAMDQLDADEVPLWSQKYKRYMSADIVQFVPFREFMGNPMLLAKETLAEVPH
jgi:vacuolar-type H+-ATPase subunit F/Vma7